MAGLYNFTIEQGSTVTFEITYKDSSGTPVDLTGYEAAMNIKTNFSQSPGVTNVLTLSSSIGDTYTKAKDLAFLSLSGSNLQKDLDSGSIGVYIGYDKSAEMAKDEYFYDLEITDADDTRTRLLQGKIKISKQVTDTEPQ